MNTSAHFPRRANFTRLASLAAIAVMVLSPTAHAQSVAFRTLHQFGNSTDGAYPASTLLQTADGNFYGAAPNGGENVYGTIFKITPTGALTVLHSFGAGDQLDGILPQALIQARDGNFYGTTEEGGANSQGTVFKITPAGVLTTLHAFDAYANGTEKNTDGSHPLGALVQGSDGNFYGTTQQGGANGEGTVFKITPAGVFTVLHTFTIPSQDYPYANADGASPRAALIQGTDGSFYGTASSGGAGGTGVIFKITSEGVLAIVHSFAPPDDQGTNGEGETPQAALVQGKDGNFYGTTSAGGLNGSPIGTGTVFKVTPAGVLTVLHTFTAYTGNAVNNDGVAPRAALIQGTDGNFYGTTIIGGSGGKGVVFRVVPGVSFTVLHAFSNTDGVGDNADGTRPIAGLTQGGAGNFYGVTSQGGVNASGTLFEVTYAPLVTSGPTATATVGQAFSYQTTARNNPTAYSALGLPSTLKIDRATGLISGTPTAPATARITLYAINGYGKNPGPLTLTIKALAPSITSADSATATVGKAFSYQITATNSPTSYGAVGLKPGLSLNKTTGLISGTPTGAPGTYAITLKAVNSGGTASKTLNLTIKAN